MKGRLTSEATLEQLRAWHADRFPAQGVNGGAAALRDQRPPILASGPTGQTVPETGEIMERGSVRLVTERKQSVDGSEPSPSTRGVA